MLRGTLGLLLACTLGLAVAPPASAQIKIGFTLSETGPAASLGIPQRNTVALRRSDGTEWSVEELIAMQFAHVRELAESAAGEKVHDVIVTVPPYYTEFERDAVVDAIRSARDGGLDRLLDLDPVLCADLLVAGRAPLQVLAAGVNGEREGERRMRR